MALKPFPGYGGKLLPQFRGHGFLSCGRFQKGIFFAAQPQGVQEAAIHDLSHRTHAHIFSIPAHIHVPGLSVRVLVAVAEDFTHAQAVPGKGVPHNLGLGLILRHVNDLTPSASLRLSIGGQHPKEGEHRGHIVIQRRRRKLRGPVGVAVIEGIA